MSSDGAEHEAHDGTWKDEISLPQLHRYFPYSEPSEKYISKLDLHLQPLRHYSIRKIQQIIRNSKMISFSNKLGVWASSFRVPPPRDRHGVCKMMGPKNDILFRISRVIEKLPWKWKKVSTRCVNCHRELVNVLYPVWCFFQNSYRQT